MTTTSDNDKLKKINHQLVQDLQQSQLQLETERMMRKSDAGTSELSGNYKIYSIMLM